MSKELYTELAQYSLPILLQSKRSPPSRQAVELPQATPALKGDSSNAAAALPLSTTPGA